LVSAGSADVSLLGEHRDNLRARIVINADQRSCLDEENSERLVFLREQDDLRID
jgi:hypothetical protein